MSPKRKLQFAVFTTAAFLLAVYLAGACWRADRMYHRLRAAPRGWRPPIHRADPMLGFAPIPDVEAAERLPIGVNIPTRLDEHGCRIPAGNIGQAGNDQGRLLALGCSFTFGAACRAEDAYPQLVAEHFKYEAHNAAVCSYGLAQMLLRGLPLIRQLRPDVVLVQYSPWLVDRAISGYAPSYIGMQPVPYLAPAAGSSATPGTRFRIQHPIFRRYDIRQTLYEDAPGSFGTYIRFLASAGLPSLIHDDLCRSMTWIGQRVRLYPPPLGNRQQVVDEAYATFARVCRKYGARLVVVILDKGIPAGRRESLRGAQGATIVDAYGTMVSALPVPGSVAYQKMYGHWGGQPKRLFDEHPNAHAHRVIADEIIKQLRR